MSRLEKLYWKVASAPANTRFDDLIQLVEALGFEELRQKGSHRIFHHPDRVALYLNLQARGAEAKEYQVKQVLAVIEREHLMRW